MITLKSSDVMILPTCELCDREYTEGQATEEGCVCAECLESVRVVDRLSEEIDFNKYGPPTIYRDKYGEEQ